MSTCFFCGAEGYRGYEGEGASRLWMCQSHWRLIGESFVEAFVKEGLIGEVDWRDD